MELPTLTLAQWSLAILASIGIGVSKAGVAGVGLLHVLIFAFIFGARDSTGVILPLLVAADLMAVKAFHSHAQWAYVRKMLPPAGLGILIGFLLMGRVDEHGFKLIVGSIILALAALQALRMVRPAWVGDRVPHSTLFAWTLGLTAGVATMLANAAGPIFAIYALAVGLPKFELVGTTAWFFLIINVSKLPFSAALGLITPSTLALTLPLVPAIAVGVAAGRWITNRLPQDAFNAVLLVFTAVAALRLIGVW